jgi:hypothetical protein
MYRLWLRWIHWALHLSSEATIVFADCLMFSGLIGMVEFSHCPREMNGVARLIARTCLNCRLSCNSVDGPLALFCHPLWAMQQLSDSNKASDDGFPSKRNTILSLYSKNKHQLLHSCTGQIRLHITKQSPAPFRVHTSSINNDKGPVAFFCMDWEAKRAIWLQVIRVVARTGF